VQRFSLRHGWAKGQPVIYLTEHMAIAFFINGYLHIFSLKNYTVGTKKIHGTTYLKG
jgi:hypothetical protein